MRSRMRVRSADRYRPGRRRALGSLRTPVLVLAIGVLGGPACLAAQTSDLGVGRLVLRPQEARGEVRGRLPGPTDLSVDDVAALDSVFEWRGWTDCLAPPRGEGEPPVADAFSRGTLELARQVLVSPLVPQAGAWRGVVLRGAAATGTDRPREVLAMRAPLTVSMCDRSGAAIALRGWAYRFARGLGVVALANSETLLEDLDMEVPAAALRWPRGMLGLAETSRRALGDGREWQARGPQRGCLLASAFPPGWPRSVRAWSNGRVVLVQLDAKAGTELEWKTTSGGTIPPESMADPAVPDGAAMRTKRLASAVEPVPVLTPVLNVTEETLALAPSMPRAARDVPTDVNEAERPTRLPGLDLLAGDTWANGALLPLPEFARLALNLPPNDGCWQVILKAHPTFGHATAGLLEAPSSGLRWRRPALLAQWVLSGERFALTVASRWGREELRSNAGDGAPAVPAPERAITAQEILAYLGPWGAHAAYTPVDREENVNESGVIYRSKPDAPFGLLGEQKVGDQPWGRFLIYTDPMVFHIVFDLPKKEAGE